MALSALQKVIGRIERGADGVASWTTPKGSNSMRHDLVDAMGERANVRLIIRRDAADFDLADLPDPLGSARPMEELRAGKPVHCYLDTVTRKTAQGARSVNEFQEFEVGRAYQVNIISALWLTHLYPWLLEDADWREEEDAAEEARKADIANEAQRQNAARAAKGK